MVTGIEPGILSVRMIYDTAGFWRCNPASAMRFSKTHHRGKPTTVPEKHLACGFARPSKALEIDLAHEESSHFSAKELSHISQPLLIRMRRFRLRRILI
jgi:hypothetical protein